MRPAPQSRGGLLVRSAVSYDLEGVVGKVVHFNYGEIRQRLITNEESLFAQVIVLDGRGCSPKRPALPICTPVYSS